MGVFIDYVLCAECPEQDLVQRLERIRERCLDLPLRSVGQVTRVVPVYNSVNISLFEMQGGKLPPEIQKRLDEVGKDREEVQIGMAFGLLPADGIPDEMQDRYLAPGIEFAETCGLWDREELPETLSSPTLPGMKPFYTINRAVLELEFANIMLRYGYALLLHPGEGSETINLGLSTYATREGSPSADPPLWHGKSFTRTQYAKNFVLVHETVCRVLDIVKEEGLLWSAGDTCGYYADRNWVKAGPQVNEEMLFAKFASGIVSLAIGNMREEGTNVTVVEDNASHAEPVDFSARLKTDPDTTGPEPTSDPQ